MAVRKRREHSQQQTDRDGPKPDEAGSQGIVRDQRGQEQPADKERAQRASKSEPDRQ
jgi:hypothetical protein